MVLLRSDHGRTAPCGNPAIANEKAQARPRGVPRLCLSLVPVLVSITAPRSSCPSRRSVFGTGQPALAKVSAHQRKTLPQGVAIGWPVDTSTKQSIQRRGQSTESETVRRGLDRQDNAHPSHLGAPSSTVTELHPSVSHGALYLLEQALSHRSPTRCANGKGPRPRRLTPV